jgi:hypothetical protein
LWQLVTKCGDDGSSKAEEAEEKSNVSDENKAVVVPATSETGPNEDRHPPPDFSHFDPMQQFPGFMIYDINMFENGMMTENLKHYFACCRDYSAPGGSLIVTTSCFTPWREAKKTNGAAKVIPAVSANSPHQNGHPIRVFFFDDNINLHLGGAHDAEGICNLRDVSTGEFVDFSIGKNGFECERLFRHTFVHHSSQYNNVLIQANILDAMTHTDYFMDIITRYSKPGEQLLVFADVNGTIMWEDTVRGKDVSTLLLGTMFRFAEVRPRASDIQVDFGWEEKPPVPVQKPEDLRGLVNRISSKDNDWYQQFWSLTTCEKFINAISSIADIAWQKEESTISASEFWSEYSKNLEDIRRSAMKDGIPESWSQAYERLVEAGHTVVLNSFGVDSGRVVARVATDKTKVLQLTINYKLWGKKDTDMWNAQFAT